MILSGNIWHHIKCFEVAMKTSLSPKETALLYCTVLYYIEEHSISFFILFHSSIIIPHSVIMAAGRMGQLDRAFATFQEYTGTYVRVHCHCTYNKVWCWILGFPPAWFHFPTHDRILHYFELHFFILRYSI